MDQLKYMIHHPVENEYLSVVDMVIDTAAGDANDVTTGDVRVSQLRIRPPPRPRLCISPLLPVM